METLKIIILQHAVKYHGARTGFTYQSSQHSLRMSPFPIAEHLSHSTNNSKRQKEKVVQKFPW